ncbi:MAG: hypothetical protein IPG31_01600 [Nitrosomonas sp.]|nr:hypothetical protein [Nitrosomonas sp.]
MIAIDTDVVVRLLTRDDAAQYEKAYQLFEKQNVFIGDTVILETEWVLRFAFKIIQVAPQPGILLIFRAMRKNQATASSASTVFSAVERGFLADCG